MFFAEGSCAGGKARLTSPMTQSANLSTSVVSKKFPNTGMNPQQVEMDRTSEIDAKPASAPRTFQGAQTPTQKHTEAQDGQKIARIVVRIKNTVTQLRNSRDPIDPMGV